MINIEIADKCFSGYKFLDMVKGRPFMRLTLREVEYLQDLFSWCRLLALEKVK